MASDPDELNRRAAERAHDHSNDLGKRLIDASWKDAQEAIKIVLLINSGAAIAILSLMTGLVSPARGGFALHDLRRLSISLYWFVAGVVAAGLSQMVAYLCNSLYSGGHLQSQKTWQHPFTEETDKSKKYFRLARQLNWGGIALVLLSFSTFIVGVVGAATAILRLAH